VHRRREAVRALIGDPVAGKELRLFGLFGFFHGRMMDDLGRANEAEAGVDRAVLRSQLLLGLVDLVTTALVVLLVVRTHPRAGEALAALAAFAGLGTALNGLVAQALHLAEGRSVLSTYDEVMAEPLVGPGGDGHVGALTDAVTLDDVWFRYGDNLPWVLRGVTLRLRAGEATALVGLNGSGKSTVVKLICGLYRPTRGAVRWDGVDTATLDPAVLRTRIAAVFQDFTTYDLSAHDNVALGAVERRDDRAEIRRAATTAGIDPVLRALPAGYDTMLSRLFYADPSAPDAARVVLSGGQWQRVALARALMRHDRDLMILDEPSAGLDPQAETEVHRAVVRTLRGTTRLLVTHRLAAVRVADRICVLSGGRIAESGRHDDLITAEGEYARLFSLQAAGYRDGPPSSGIPREVGDPIPATP
jgi:ATP-binding cassette subfamily B protein